MNEIHGIKLNSGEEWYIGAIKEQGEDWGEEQHFSVDAPPWELVDIELGNAGFILNWNRIKGNLRDQIEVITFDAVTSVIYWDDGYPI